MANALDDRGGVTVDAGGVVVDLGGVAVDAGDVAVDLGGVAIDLGDVAIDVGDVAVDLGGIVVDDAVRCLMRPCDPVATPLVSTGKRALVCFVPASVVDPEPLGAPMIYTTL